MHANHQRHLGALLTLLLLLGPSLAQARMYNQDSGRFMTMDSDEGDQLEPRSLHLYIFCEADPENSIDPTGHDEIFDALAGLDSLSTLVGELTPVFDLFKLAGQKVTVQLITEIRPPDAQAGVKTRQLIVVNGLGMIVRKGDFTGITQLVIAAPTGHSTFRQWVSGGPGQFTLTATVRANSAVLPSKFDIDYNFDLHFNFKNRTGVLTGVHDTYPSYHVNVNGKSVFDFRQKGSPLNLYGPGNIPVNTPFTF